MEIEEEEIIVLKKEIKKKDAIAVIEELDCLDLNVFVKTCIVPIIECQNNINVIMILLKMERLSCNLRILL